MMTQRLHRAPVAQLDRASAFEAEGREFESLRARHLLLLYHSFGDGHFFFCLGCGLTVIKTSYKKECQETFFSVGSVPTLFLSRHSAQPFERALAIGEWSCSGDVVSCFVSSHETVRSLFLPVVPLHCRDGAHSFLETTKHNDCRIANHGPI
jgi:hypothetical protein